MASCPVSDTGHGAAGAWRASLPAAYTVHSVQAARIIYIYIYYIIYIYMAASELDESCARAAGEAL